MFGKLLSSVFNGIQIKRRPLDEILEKTAFFLKPQLQAMAKLDGNKFAFITYESVFYMLEIAEAIGGRQIVNDERDLFFLTILGSEYKPRIDRIFYDIQSGNNDPERVAASATALKQMAREDVKNGMFGCGHYLLKNAQYISEREKSMRCDEV